ncbi:hypothetical protein RFI_05500, partial [Reticulomyxa filosa]
MKIGCNTWLTVSWHESIGPLICFSLLCCVHIYIHIFIIKISFLHTFECNCRHEIEQLKNFSGGHKINYSKMEICPLLGSNMVYDFSETSIKPKKKSININIYLYLYLYLYLCIYAPINKNKSKLAASVLVLEKKPELVEIQMGETCGLVSIHAVVQLMQACQDRVQLTDISDKSFPWQSCINLAAAEGRDIRIGSYAYLLNRPQPLLVAVTNSGFDKDGNIFRLLLQNGYIDVNLMDEKGQSVVFHLVKQMNYKQLNQLFSICKKKNDESFDKIRVFYSDQRKYDIIDTRNSSQLPSGRVAVAVTVSSLSRSSSLNNVVQVIRKPTVNFWVYEMLLENGADPNFMCHEKSPLCHALEMREQEVKCRNLCACVYNTNFKNKKKLHQSHQLYYNHIQTNKDAGNTNTKWCTMTDKMDRPKIEETKMRSKEHSSEKWKTTRELTMIFTDNPRKAANSAHMNDGSNSPEVSKSTEHEVQLVSSASVVNHHHQQQQQQQQQQQTQTRMVVTDHSKDKLIKTFTPPKGSILPQDSFGLRKRLNASQLSEKESKQKSETVRSIDKSFQFTAAVSDTANPKDSDIEPEPEAEAEVKVEAEAEVEAEVEAEAEAEAEDETETGIESETETKTETEITIEDRKNKEEEEEEEEEEEYLDNFVEIQPQSTRIHAPMTPSHWTFNPETMSPMVSREEKEEGEEEYKQNDTVTFNDQEEQQIMRTVGNEKDTSFFKAFKLLTLSSHIMDTAIVNAVGDNPLHLLCRDHHDDRYLTKKLSYLLAYCEEWKFIKNKNGEIPLHYALRYQHGDMLDLLLQTQHSLDTESVRRQLVTVFAEDTNVSYVWKWICDEAHTVANFKAKEKINFPFDFKQSVHHIQTLCQLSSALKLADGTDFLTYVSDLCQDDENVLQLLEKDFGFTVKRRKHYTKPQVRFAQNPVKPKSTKALSQHLEPQTGAMQMNNH